MADTKVKRKRKRILNVYKGQLAFKVNKKLIKLLLSDDRVDLSNS